MDVTKEKAKFTCYFCHKTIENDTETGHIAVCSRVLIPCSNKCGSYIPRIDLKKHQKECLNRMSQSMQHIPSNQPQMVYGSVGSPSSTVSLDRHMNGYIQTPTIQHNEIKKLSQKISILEQKLLYNNQTLQNTLQKQNNDPTKNVQFQQQSLEIEKLKYQNKTLFDWKRNFESHLDSIKNSVATAQNFKRDLELRIINLQDKVVLLEKFNFDLNYLREMLFKEQSANRQIQSIVEQDIRSFKTHYSQEAASFASVLNDHTYIIDTLKTDIENLTKTNDDAKIKFSNLVFDLKAASQIASEASERIEIIERNFSQTKKEISQIKMDLEILEGLVTSNDFHSKPGRLLWKVTNVEAKLGKAKEFDTVVKSQVFFTHEYGYKARILMYLNGFKKWRDRYCLLCIHVLKGEYDMLLKWPCNIEGSITLRNLEDLDKAKQFTKIIQARRNFGDEEDEEPQESTSSYIFIPHSTLFSKQFMKDDTFFFDIKINKNDKQETSL